MNEITRSIILLSKRGIMLFHYRLKLSLRIKYKFKYQPLKK